MINFLKYHFKCLCRSIKFFTLAYKNEDYDYNYLLVLMGYKLERIENEMMNSHISNKELKKLQKQIKTTRLVIKRLTDCNYLENSLINHEHKYGEIQHNFVPSDYSDNYGKLYSMETTYSKCKTKDENKEASKNFMRCSNHSDYLENQDLDLLFKLMRKYIKGWWC